MSTFPAAIEYATVPGSGLSSPARIQQPVPGVLDVVAVVSNPVRFNSRFTLFRNFERHMLASGARLTTLECAFGNRPFEVTEAGNPFHIQVRTDHEYWGKERYLNLAINRLPRSAEYIAWVDADLTFLNPTFVQDTLQALQTYRIVQMFSEAHDLGPDGHIVNSFRSFGWSHVHGVPRRRPGGTGYYGGVPIDNQPKDSRINYFWHPGFAWAARRSTLNTLGGLFDVGVIGESDWIMAKAILGEAEDVLYPGVSPGYRKAVMDWQTQAQKIRRDIGYVPGAVAHGWHGAKARRKYYDRCSILRDTQFDPSTDLKLDCEGLYQLVDHGDTRSVLLRDSIRGYFRQRAEDSMEL